MLSIYLNQLEKKIPLIYKEIKFVDLNFFKLLKEGLYSFFISYYLWNLKKMNQNG